MLFRAYTPRAPLAEFVEDFRLYERYRGEHRWERILPSGTFERVFNLRDDGLRIYRPSERDPCRRFAGALVSGPYAGPFMTDAAEEAAILGVHFRPGGAAALLGVPAAELANTHTDLRTIWGPEATELRHRLCACADPVERFRLLEHALMKRLDDRPRRHGAVRLALGLLVRTQGRRKVRDIARAVDLSPRRFIEVFAAEVGLAPKMFGRIQRFQRALALSQSSAGPDWAQLAVDCGYFDQSHLIREFIEFSGMSPSAFQRRHERLAQAGAHVKRNHLPLADEVNFFQ